MNRLLVAGLVLAMSVLSTNVSFADQLENESHEVMQGPAPKGVMVKVNPETKTVEVFKAPELSTGILNQSATADETATMIRNVETPANKIAEFKLSTHELDKDSSTEAWCGRWNYGGWGWNNWCGCRPYYYNWYRPYYYYPGSFSYCGGYNYNYGWNYGYNGCNYGWYY